MIKNMNLLIYLLCLVACSAQKNEPVWNLVWSDEFNYSGLPDTSKWGNEVGFIRNHELQYYTKQRLDNTIVENGNLLIIGKRNHIRMQITHLQAW